MIPSMNGGLEVLVLAASLVLLLAMRWAHRNWGKAILATIFAPLVVVPMGLVAFLAFGMILRVVDAILSPLGGSIPPGIMGWIAGVLTGALILVLFVRYCRDQRDVSRIETGPWLGAGYRAPEPRIYRKERLK